MRTIIAGSRDITDQRTVDIAIANSHFAITELVSGGARGVDRCGERYAEMRGIPVKQFLADWNGPLGKGAGHARNREMAAYADALIAIWDGKSPGTKSMIEYARQKKLHVHVELV